MDNSLETQTEFETTETTNIETETTDTEKLGLSEDDAVAALVDLFDETETVNTNTEESEDAPEETTEEESDENPSEEESDDAPVEGLDEETDDQLSNVDIDDKEFTITVDGEEVVVKGNELKNGYMRQAAFTKKTQEVAEQRKAIDQERLAMAEQAHVLGIDASNRLAQIENAIAQEGGWEAVKAKYSVEQIQQFSAAYQDAQSKAQLAEATVNDYRNTMKEQNTHEIKSIFTDMSKEISGFNSSTISDMDRYLSANGFDADTVMGITTRPAWDIIYKSMMYDKSLMRRAAEKPKPKSVKEKSAPTTVKADNSLSKVLTKQAKAKGRDANEAASLEALAAILS